MIVSASYRTDIPAYYRDWFLNRLRAGEAVVANPYGGRPSVVDLTPAAVDGFVFWTRNPLPFADGFDAVARMGRPFMVQMTITGYPRALEPGVLDAEAAAGAFRALARRYGPRALVWRYDPVLLTEATPPERHLANVRRLAGALRGAADECVFSFAHIYRKSARNLNAAGLAWRDPPADEKRQLLGALAGVVAEAGFSPTLCAQPEFLTGGIEPARCIDPDRLHDLGAADVSRRARGARPGCLCAESRDIGRYDACPQGCAYCYANRSRAAARRTLAGHDVDVDRL
ncbi:MAG: DUF1848 domain-containing protein [Alphaproteobacteria bacterium]